MLRYCNNSVRLLGCLPLVLCFLFAWRGVYAEGCNGSAALDLLNSECLGLDIGCSGLTWRCQGTCIDPFGSSTVNLDFLLDTSSDEISKDSVGFFLSCTGIGPALGVASLGNLQAITEVDFKGILGTKACNKFPEVICTLVSLPETPAPTPSEGCNGDVELDLLISDCLGEDIANTGLTWRCHGTCTDFFFGTQGEICLILNTNSNNNNIIAGCDGILIPGHTESLGKLQAINRVDFKGTLATKVCSPFPELICTLVSLPGTLTTTILFPSPILPTPHVSPTPSPSPLSGKLFTFECGRELEAGPRELEKLVLQPGEVEHCILRMLTDRPTAFVEVSTNLRTGFRTSIMVSPTKSITNVNGELEFTITAIEMGVDWVAWALANEDGEFEFNKKAYDIGRAWGMFVEVR